MVKNPLSFLDAGTNPRAIVDQVICTTRILLRRWLPTDREPLAQLNADPRVMEFFPARLTRHESDAQFDRIQQHFQEHGFGFWAVEIPGTAKFAGFIGLGVPRFEAHFTPCVEIGWRLAAEHWGRGYATEGATAVLDYGFRELGLSEIVSFTSKHNARSRRVMERIGMKLAESEEFDHPALPADHRLARHVLYRKSSAPPD